MSITKQVEETGARARENRRFSQGFVLGTDPIGHTAKIDVGIRNTDGSVHPIYGVPYSPQNPPQVGAVVSLDYFGTSVHGLRIVSAGVGGQNDQSTVVVNAANAVPAGGTDGQVLTKQSSTDYDTDWENPVQTRWEPLMTGYALPDMLSELVLDEDGNCVMVEVPI